jgi:DNA-binding response OmpR family regulator
MAEQQIQILVVDDDKEIANLVEIYLSSTGYIIHKAYNAMDGLAILQKEDIQLAIIDVMMPRIDGIELCKRIRSKKNIPIIMLSAKSADVDKILGLSAGADDYVIKPFNPMELLARVKSQLRRYLELNPGTPVARERIEVQDVVIDTNKHKVTVGGKEVVLTPIEFNILQLMASHPGRVYSTDEIYENVWNEKLYEANNTVMVHMRRLREKVEKNPRQPQLIKTVWGVGYKIEG